MYTDMLQEDTMIYTKKQIADRAYEYYEMYTPKIMKLVYRYPKNLRDDLLQEAYLGIIKSLQKSTYKSGADDKPEVPAQYMLYWVRYYMRQYMHRNKKVVSIGRHIDHDKLEIEALYEEYKKGDEQSPEDYWEMMENIEEFPQIKKAAIRARKKAENRRSQVRYKVKKKDEDT